MAHRSCACSSIMRLIMFGWMHCQYGSQSRSLFTLSNLFQHSLNTPIALPHDRNHFRCTGVWPGGSSVLVTAQDEYMLLHLLALTQCTHNTHLWITGSSLGELPLFFWLPLAIRTFWNQHWNIIKGPI